MPRCPKAKETRTLLAVRLVTESGRGREEEDEGTGGREGVAAPGPLVVWIWLRVLGHWL